VLQGRRFGGGNCGQREREYWRGGKDVLQVTWLVGAGSLIGPPSSTSGTTSLPLMQNAKSDDFISQTSFVTTCRRIVSELLLITSHHRGRETTSNHPRIITYHHTVMATSRQEEIEEARKRFPKIQIPTATSAFAHVLYTRTPTKRIKATLTFPEGYPRLALIVSVSEVPPAVKKKLDIKLTEIAKENVSDNKYVQVPAVLESMQTFLDTNRFVPCWKELRQSVLFMENLAASEESAKGSAILSIHESKGQIKVKLVNGMYHYTCLVTVDEYYPTTESIHDWGKACAIQKSSTNFPPLIEGVLTQQYRDLVRHLQDGMPEQEAFRAVAPALWSSSSSSSSLVTKPLQGPRSRRTKPAAAKDKRPSATPSKKDLESWQEDEASRLSQYDIPLYDGSNPQPSLLSLVKFMTAVIQGFTSQTCPGCDERIIPTDPANLAALYSSSSTPATQKPSKATPKERPLQASCGCWYHAKCLDQFLTQPPFGDQCSAAGCGQANVTHPNWTASQSEREQQWALQQARQREMDDVMGLF
jgi:hypothetical protein